MASHLPLLDSLLRCSHGALHRTVPAPLSNFISFSMSFSTLKVSRVYIGLPSKLAFSPEMKTWYFHTAGRLKLSCSCLNFLHWLEFLFLLIVLPLPFTKDIYAKNLSHHFSHPHSQQVFLLMPLLKCLSCLGPLYIHSPYFNEVFILCLEDIIRSTLGFLSKISPSSITCFCCLKREDVGTKLHNKIGSLKLAAIILQTL